MNSTFNIFHLMISSIFHTLTLLVCSQSENSVDAKNQVPWKHWEWMILVRFLYSSSNSCLKTFIKRFWNQMWHLNIFEMIRICFREWYWNMEMDIWDITSSDLIYISQINTSSVYPVDKIGTWFTTALINKYNKKADRSGWFFR